jgi:hypothetical protein
MDSSVKKHVIFLDIDGVLVSYLDLRVYDEFGQKFIQEAVDSLNCLISQLDADVCISSAWRVGKSVERLQEIMDARGVQCKVVGKTEHFGPRGLEILKWLEDNPEYTDYVIIDDEMSVDILPHIPYHYKTHIHTNMYRCLDMYDVAVFSRDYWSKLPNYINRTKTNHGRKDNG